MASVSVQYQYLAPNPKSSYKQLFVKGTQLRARVLYGSYMSEDEPRSIEEIAADYALPLEAVKEAIAYCESRPPELLEDYRREAALVEAAEGGGPHRNQAQTAGHLAPEEIAAIRRQARQE
jgi:uncharacterized protein (DUF433 family)